MTTESFTPGPEHKRALRTAFGSFATGVTVVTCRDETGPLAITANSFSSVSLDPPLLLWCPAVTSPRHDAFVGAVSFSVHVLEADQIALSERFAADARNFDGVNWIEGPGGAPQIVPCLTRFDCLRFAAHDAGDHTIVLGLVEQVTHTPGVPLVFALGSYGRLGPPR